MGRLIDADAFLRYIDIGHLRSQHEVCFSESDVAKMIEKQPTIEIDGNTSDGYHTFNELYHHRAVLFSVICNSHPQCSWKAKKHHDGSMYDGMFIVGINTSEGQATYHYDIEPYWEMFEIPEREYAPEWDGHTPDEAIRRIGIIDAEIVKHGRWILGDVPRGYFTPGGNRPWVCSECGEVVSCMLDRPTYKYCRCGAKMDGGSE